GNILRRASLEMRMSYSHFLTEHGHRVISTLDFDLHLVGGKDYRRMSSVPACTYGADVAGYQRLSEYRGV
ncbi:MAG: hypothetical protein KAJ01_09310, partial [Candidatus Hydrogenedentes bacterium]|nr:hypothetical protein [Candidatus Hydrogenedentota bacterium]